MIAHVQEKLLELPAALRRLLIAALIFAPMAPQGAVGRERLVQREERDRTARQLFLIDRQSKMPFPKLNAGSAENNALADLNLALSEFWKGSREGVDASNSRLEQFLASVQNQPYYKGKSPQHRAGAPADNDYFHFQIAQYLYRIERMFGPEGTRARDALSLQNTSRIHRILFDWARTECRLADTDPRQTWTIWGSENHGALKNSACWAAATLAKSDALIATEHYDDNSSPAEQAQRWTEFIKSYLRERGRHGTLVEYFSPTYAQYTLLNIYMYLDFGSDPEMKVLARNTIDAWWAEWAQEQIDNIHAGSKTRNYSNRIADGTALPTTAWFYFGGGKPPGNLPPGESGMLVSDYRPPALITDLATDPIGRGEYDVLTRAPGLPSSPTELGFIYHVDAVKNGVLRATHVAPEFAMGLGMLPLLPDKAWTAISSQNRWAGLIFSGGDKLARIVPSVLLPAGQKSYNALFGVQSSATQLVRGIFAKGQHAPQKFGVWFGEPLRRLEQGDWIFVDATAYAAVRPAFGGWRPDPDNAGWMVLNDPRAPVIIQAARKENYPNMSAFVTAVTQMPITITSNDVSVAGLGKAGTLKLGLGDNGTLMIDSKLVDLQPPFVLHSPFVNQELNSGRIIITKDNQSLEINAGQP